MAEPEKRVVGRYELHSELAAGGMAAVYLGRLIGAAGFAKSVAIKRLHSHMAEDPEFVASLLDEARLAERVRHPNVVATIDVVAEDKELLLVMEYVHGETLARLLRASIEAKEACPAPIAARVVYDVLLGLHAAHNSTDALGKALCIIHRDVSPQNVMVGADGVTRLVDFGVAKALGSIGHTREGHLKGKIAYMAPELLRYEPPSPQTDVWAAAVVLWEARCGRRLFRGDSEVQVWGQVLEGAIPDPATLTSPPSPLDDVIMRGLARNATDRYATALEMAEDIERSIRLASPAEVAAWVAVRAGPALASREALLRAVEGAAPVARPSVPSPVETDASPPTRRRAPVIFAAAVAMVAIVAAGGLTARKWTSSSDTRATPEVSQGPAPTLIVQSASEAGADDAGVSSAERPDGAADEPSTQDASVATPSHLAADAAVAHRPGASGRPHAPGAPTPRGSQTPRVSDAGSSPPVVVVAPSASSAPRARPECDPPFFVDATGHKRFKIECVAER